MPNLHVGHYGAFIWPAYVLTAVVLVWMVVDTLLRARAWKARSEAARKPSDRKMKRWVAFLPLAVLGLLAVLFAGYGLRHDPKVNPAALVGKPLPDLALPPLSGGSVQRVKAQLQGPTFVNVFASWCVPCAVEAPA